ncbi:AraC family transcriptional regulator [Pseudomonas sp. YuFO20]|uniref:AraC family transcriptional regulator n=1 Tax=Pseudomonas neuropathica TaxID=2730425 RepID=A0ACC7MNS2_9PSED|nr:MULTISPECIES: AraC family transcriptional regulator [Pseudomonas]MDD2098952.1 AraC family transcriptional regulator [Pseudomonas putida]MEB2517924.1 AraC family transcriptional regulator [Pseudomonas sp. YuFO20]
MALMARTAALTNYLELCTQLALNPLPLLNEFALSKAMLKNPELRIPMTVVAKLLEASAKASGCETFGLRMAESRQLSSFGAISLLLTHQPTLRDALTTIGQYRHLLNESLAMDISETDKIVIIREEITIDPATPKRQSIELAIGVLHRLCSALLGKSWRPQSVSFTHNAPADLNVHRRVFGCNVEFNCQFNGIVCLVADLNTANPTADPVMANYAREFFEALPGASKGSTLNEVRQAIYLLLPMDRASISLVAQSLDVNVRTLQRRLEDSGVSFSELHDQVRRELLNRYMANPRYSFSQVAGLLGYSTPSSFTRWFTAQYGMTPTAWRRQNLDYQE